MDRIEQLSHAICSSFLHSLWQAALVAIVGLIACHSSGKMKPATRYNIWCSLMGIFVTGFVLTVISEFQKPGIVASSGNATGVEDRPLSIMNWVLRYSMEIVFIWTFIFLVKIYFTIRSIHFLQDLKNNRSALLPKEWQRKVCALANSLGIKIGVTLKESVLVHQPLVVGFFKPVVLFPVGLVNHLSIAEVEAIVLHELAHIRRRDFLVNLIQNFVESVFFFNPFLLYISKQLRTEREFCCDELAVAKSNKKVFLEALVSFSQFQSKTNYAVGFSGNPSLMVQRVNNIMGNSRKNYFSTLLLIIFFIAGLSSLLLFGFRENAIARRDTIEKIGYSQEFLDGYQAGLNYSDTTSSHWQEGYRLAVLYNKKKGKAADTTAITNEIYKTQYPDKKNIELRLSSRKKN